MNLTYFRPKMRGNVENKNNNPVIIRFVDKTADIRNFIWEHHIWCHVNIPEVATLVSSPVATAGFRWFCRPPYPTLVSI